METQPKQGMDVLPTSTSEETHDRLRRWAVGKETIERLVADETDPVREAMLRRILGETVCIS